MGGVCRWCHTEFNATAHKQHTCNRRSNEIFSCRGPRLYTIRRLNGVGVGGGSKWGAGTVINIPFFAGWGSGL
jgi:hypothetical protein